MRNKIKIFLILIISLKAFAGVTNLDLRCGVASANIKNETKTMYSIGYEVVHIFDNRVVFGAGIDFDYANLNEGYVMGYGADFKLGYNIYKTLNLYALGSAKKQNFESDFNGYGFGYGGGVDFKISRNLGAAMEYKTYSMKTESLSGDYDFDIFSFSMKYLF